MPGGGTATAARWSSTTGPSRWSPGRRRPGGADRAVPASAPPPAVGAAGRADGRRRTSRAQTAAARELLEETGFAAAYLVGAGGRRHLARLHRRNGADLPGHRADATPAGRPDAERRGGGSAGRPGAAGRSRSPRCSPGTIVNVIGGRRAAGRAHRAARRRADRADRPDDPAGVGPARRCTPGAGESATHRCCPASPHAREPDGR